MRWACILYVVGLALMKRLLCVINNSNDNENEGSRRGIALSR